MTDLNRYEREYLSNIIRQKIFCEEVSRVYYERNAVVQKYITSLSEKSGESNIFQDREKMRSMYSEIHGRGMPNLFYLDRKDRAYRYRLDFNAYYKVGSLVYINTLSLNNFFIAQVVAANSHLNRVTVKNLNFNNNTTLNSNIVRRDFPQTHQ